MVGDLPDWCHHTRVQLNVPVLGTRLAPIETLCPHIKLIVHLRNNLDRPLPQECGDFFAYDEGWRLPFFGRLHFEHLGQLHSVSRDVSFAVHKRDSTAMHVLIHYHLSLGNRCRHRLKRAWHLRYFVAIVATV